jgi:hypothetical protein
MNEKLYQAAILRHAHALEPGVVEAGYSKEKFWLHVNEMKHLTRADQVREFVLVYALGRQLSDELVVSLKAVERGIEEVSNAKLNGELAAMQKAAAVGDAGAERILNKLATMPEVAEEVRAMKPSGVNRTLYPHDGGEYFYSDLQVMQSPAGYYIGRICWDKAEGFPEPLSRESDYFYTKEEAEKALKGMSFEVRECMENQDAYEKGRLPRPETKPNAAKRRSRKKRK